MVRVIWHKAASPPHMEGSVIFARWRQCAPIYRKPKWLPWQQPLGAGYRQYLPFVGQPLKVPSITNCLVAIVYTNPVNINFSPKIGCHGNVPQHCWTPSNTWFLGPIRAHNPNGISIGSAVFAQGTTGCPYTLKWDALFPAQNCPFPVQGHVTQKSRTNIKNPAWSNLDIVL